MMQLVGCCGEVNQVAQEQLTGWDNLRGKRQSAIEGQELMCSGAAASQPLPWPGCPSACLEAETGPELFSPA